jgi:hypothetical protein
MKHQYLIVEIVTPKGVCRLRGIKNVPNWANMHQNEPQAGRFPDDAAFQMNPDFPKDIKLADVLSNGDEFLVVSEKLKDFLTKEKLLAHNEVHPVTILNHKGRKEAAPYFIIHQIDDPACVDEAKTVGDKSKLMSDQYNTMEKLVLNEKKIGADYAILRAAQYKDRILVRDDAAKKIEDAGFTGIKFCDLDGYDNFW